MLNVCSQIENITSGIAHGWYLPVEPSGESAEAENEKESRLSHCAYPVCAMHEHRYYTAGLTVLSDELAKSSCQAIIMLGTPRSW